MKRFLMTLLLLAMLPSSLAGCGQQKENEVPGSNGSDLESGAQDSAVDTTILKESDVSMLNTYTLLAVNPDAPFTDADGNSVTDIPINTSGAQALIDWFLTDEALELAAGFGQEEFGDSLFYVLDDAPRYTGQIAPATDDTKQIRLSTTTSVNDSGLLDYLLPVFENAYGYTVEVQSAGTGKAIAAAQYGNADLILVHAESQENAFVDAGYSYVLDGFSSERLSFLYNYFVLCGPSDDPAGVKNCESVQDAFAAIADGKYPFISRGDASGTHTKELSLWPAELGITEDAASFADYTDWYVSANAGMGTCLTMAEELHAYILTDKATFLTFQANSGVIS